VPSVSSHATPIPHPGKDLAERKRDRIRDAMRADGIAGIVLCENGRTRYLTGYQRYHSATQLAPAHAVVMTLDDGPILMVPRHIVPATEDCAAERVIEYPLSQADKVAALADLVAALGLTGECVGVEFEFMPHGFAAALGERLPKVRLVDASPVLRGVTAIKFAEEIAILRQAAHIADLGVAAAIEAALEGVSEIEIGARSSAAMLDAGAEFVNHMTIRSGPHAAALFPLLTPRRLAKGDCVQIDIGCVYQGYVSDTNRSIVIGPPSAEQRILMEVGQRMLEAGLAAVRDGIEAQRLWRVCRDVAAARDLDQWMAIPFVGHGIGLSLHEPPLIAPASPDVLARDMVLALEPGLFVPGVGASRPEDMLRVTADGCEVLTHHPRDHDMLSET
jgi:Xaa-Pro aminopeptidase